MPAMAFLFVECVPDRARSVLSRLKRIPGVRDAHIVTGEYDIIAILEAPGAETVGEVVLSRVQNIPGVRKTTTNPAVE